MNVAIFCDKGTRHIKKVFTELFLYPDFKESNMSYDEYWKKMIGTEFDKINSFQKIRAYFVLGFMADGDTIADIGCGNGAVIREIRKNKHLKTYAIDYSNYVLDKLKGLDFETIFLDINDKNVFEKIPKVDHCLMLEVLEHLPHSEKFLKDALNHSNKSVFFSFPNTGNVIHRFRMLTGKFPLQWVAHPGEHLRFWTYSDLKWWLKSIGLYDQCTILVYGGFPILRSLFPGLFGRSFIVRVNK